jgi:hypothetical protein
MASATYTDSYDADASGTIIGPTLGSVTITDDSAPAATAPLNTAGQITSDIGSYNQIIKYNSITNEVLVSDGTNYIVLTNSNSTGIQPTFDATSADYTYCFLKGTRISTPIGSIAIENLKVGDEIFTHDGNVAKVRFNFNQIKTTHRFVNKKHYPIKISANALGDNIPSKDLYVTPDHAIYLPEFHIFAEASTLINGMSIYQMQEMPASFIYHHILCDNQEIVLAENTPTETFIDNATMQEFDNYADYAAMYPDEHEMIELDIPRAKSSRQLPRALKQGLVARAAEQLYPSLLSQAA